MILDCQPCPAEMKTWTIRNIGRVLTCTVLMGEGVALFCRTYGGGGGSVLLYLWGGVALFCCVLRSVYLLFHL